MAEAAQVHHTVRQYLREVEQQNPVEEPVHEQDQVSTTDPDSTYATQGGTSARLGYYDKYSVDNDTCVIVGVQATAARMSQETVAAQDMLTRFAEWQKREPNRWRPIRPMATGSSCNGSPIAASPLHANPLAGMEKLVDQVFLIADVPRQQVLYK